MKSIKYILMLYLLLPGIVSYAQSAKTKSADVKVSFKVYGVCGQCKERIEEAAMGKGVKNANWDENSQMLSLEYNPSKVSLKKLQNRIVAVGHDVESLKATASVYQALPKCCLYRDLGTVKNHGTNEMNGC